MKLLFIVLTLTATCSYAQVDISRDVMAAAGSTFSNSNMQMSFTIGEPLTSTFVNGNVLTQGFQQGDLSALSIHEIEGEKITLYPNPANEEIRLEITSGQAFDYRVHDVTGRIVREGKSPGGILILNVQDLVEGKYFIEYQPENGVVQHLPFITLHQL